MIDLTRVDWRREGVGLLYAVGLAVIVTAGMALREVDTLAELQAVDWTLLALTVGRSALSALLAAAGIAIPGISSPREPPA